MPPGRWTIRPHGPDGLVDHFYADGYEQPVPVVPCDDEAVERGAEALCRFLFPGYAVPREEMVRAVLAAIADDGLNWRDRLPAQRRMIGGPE
jgi:hypothetical protein